MRSDLGAIENRLAYTVSNLMNIAEKTADARSRLDDADYAQSQPGSLKRKWFNRQVPRCWLRPIR